MAKKSINPDWLMCNDFPRLVLAARIYTLRGERLFKSLRQLWLTKVATIVLMWTQSRFLSKPVNTQRRIVKKKRKNWMEAQNQQHETENEHGNQFLAGNLKLYITSYFPGLVIPICTYGGSFLWAPGLIYRYMPMDSQERAVFKIETMVSVSKVPVRRIKSKATHFGISCY